MHPLVEKNKCESHGDYDASRSPTSECAGCWRFYNLAHDLPEANRTPKSRFKKVVRVSGRVPEMYPLASVSGSSNFFGALEEHTKDLKRQLVPICVGIDASLRSSGVSFIMYARSNRRWYTCSFADGMSLSQDASTEMKMNRQISIIESCVKGYRAFTAGIDEHVPVYIEDHAYSRAHTNRATEAHELHGVIKSQFYLLTGKPVEPVGIKSARAEVFCHGSPPGDTKDALLSALRERGSAWIDGLTDDEIDAWTVAATHVKENYPFGVIS